MKMKLRKRNIYHNHIEQTLKAIKKIWGERNLRILGEILLCISVVDVNKLTECTAL